jgi:hypothetical protein
MSLLELQLLNGKEAIRGKKVVASNSTEVDMFSVYDFINVVCGKGIKQSYGRVIYFNLTSDNSEYKDEVVKSTTNLKFPGRGQRDTPCMSMRGLQRLLMILGGKVATEYRALVETTFTRVMAGDRSLIKVIEANAESKAPMQQACREALVHDPLPGDHALDEMALNRKRKNEDLEYEERVEALELKRVERIKMQVECMKNQVVVYHIVKLSYCCVLI